MLILEGEGKAVDDAAQDLQQLRYPVVPLHLVHKLKEDVVDGAADEGAEVQELAVDAVQGGLEEVALPRVLAVKELQQLCVCVCVCSIA